MPASSLICTPAACQPRMMHSLCGLTTCFTRRKSRRRSAFRMILYGIGEMVLPLEYAITVCNLFAELGARSVSVLNASGNYSVGAVGAGSCKVNDDSGRVQFTPMFPASCMRDFISRWKQYANACTSFGHRIATVSQVRGSLASAARRVTELPLLGCGELC